MLVSDEYHTLVRSYFDTYCMESGYDLDSPTPDEIETIRVEGFNAMEAAMDLIDRKHAARFKEAHDTELKKEDPFEGLV